jgi:hypothetical protein
MSYPNNDTNKVNMNIINNIVDELKTNNSYFENTTYDAAKVETERLLNREMSLFMINSVITLGLMITVFRIIS